MISDSGRSKRSARSELLVQRRREVARVEEAGLRVDARLLLELRDAQRAVDEQQRRDRERDQPRVAHPEGGDPDAERREHEVGREALEREEAGLAQGVAAREVQHRRQQEVVDADASQRRRRRPAIA